MFIMPAPAPHFSPKALTFFRQLEKNNDRQWFTPRKPVFEEECRKPMIELVAWLNDKLRKFAVEHVTEPKRAIYRIYRDTRFSKDKTPYKTHIGALFARKGLPRHGGANYFVGVSHKGVEIAGGMYMPEPAELAAVRAAILSNPKASLKRLATPSVVKLVGEIKGSQAVRMPKGHEEHEVDSPLGSLLRRKQLYYDISLPADVALKPTLGKEVLRRFEVMASVVDWLNEAILAAKTDEDDGRPKRPMPMF